MENIIIDGIDLSQLKVEYDALAVKQAALRASIVKGSSKFIADNIKEAREVLDEILKTEDSEKLDNLIEVAYNKLQTSKFVSDVSGVGYMFPYYDRQSDYCPDGETYSSQLESSDNDLLPERGTNKKFDALTSLLDSMESDVSEWNTSYC